MSINFPIIIKVIGAISFCIGAMMLIPLVVALSSDIDSCSGLFYSAMLGLVLGAVLFLSTRNANPKLGKREGYLIVSLGWLAAGVISALPYLLTDLGITSVESLFESISGLTTTGATIFNDIEVLPSGILLWRSMTQWIGGMGIIVLTVAIFPLLGIGGVELFVAESPGPTSNKIHPRIKETAKRLWLLYLGISCVIIIVLRLLGMTTFDAINHGLTTVATGGFSTKNASMAAFGPSIHYCVLFFMFIAGINYSLIYAGLRGKFTKVWRSDEFKTYVGFVTFSILLVTSVKLYHTDIGLEQAFRDGAFHVVSLITTTGYISADYTLWHPSLTVYCFMLLFAGACAGSTAGGIKIIRHMVFAKNSLLEFKRILHPNGLIRLRIDKQLVAPRILTHVLVFLLLYLGIFAIGTVIMTFMIPDVDQPLLTSAGAVATSLGNVGPAIAGLGPTDNFSDLPGVAKVFLSFIMLLGRLELFSILILFSPYFWKSN